MACYRSTTVPRCYHLFNKLSSWRHFSHHHIHGSAASTSFSSYSIPRFARMVSTEVSASEQMSIIKQLRERTCAPIKDVKSSLIACDWDIEAAQKELRKKGVVIATRKTTRTATEGLIALAQNERKVAAVELNCETDFVARNEIFQSLAVSLARLALSAENPIHGTQTNCPFGPEFLENMKINLDHPKLSGEASVQSAVTEVAAMVGENVKLRRGFLLNASSHGIVCSYLHACPQPGLGRIAGMVTLDVEDGNHARDALHRVGSSLAMHIVAAKPLFLAEELVPSEALEGEREIARSRAERAQKPPAVTQKMVEGHLKKYFKEVVLLDQNYVVNDSVNIKTLLKDLSQEVGSCVTIGSFLRMEVGEGIPRIETSDSSNAIAQAAA